MFFMSFPERTAGRDIHQIRIADPRVAPRNPIGNLQSRNVEIRQVPGQDRVICEICSKTLAAKGVVCCGRPQMSQVVIIQSDNRSGHPTHSMVGPAGHQQVGTRKPN